MTVASTTNRADLTITSGTTSYPYAFRIFADGDLVVVRRHPTTGAETALVLNTDYTVTGAGNANGGTIVISAGDATTYNGYGLTIRRVLATTQSTSIRNQGAFYPEVHEDVFDRLAMVDQQLDEEIDRSVKLPATVAASAFDPTLPAGVTAGAGRTLLVNASGNGFEVGPTATEISSAQSAATAALAALDSFDDRYLGAKASDPTLDNDGNALLSGALYWNTTTNAMRAYTGSKWTEFSSVAYVPVTYTGDGITTAFTLPVAPVSKNNVFVSIAGVNQHKSRFSVSGTTLTFVAAPPSGNEVECIVAQPLPVASADAANVTYLPEVGAQTDVRTRLRSVDLALKAVINVTAYGASTSASASVNDAAFAAAISDLGNFQELLIPGPGTYQCTTLDFTGKDNFGLRIDAKLSSQAAKPAGALVDDRNTSSGVLPTLKFVNCDRFRVYGSGVVENRYREAIYLSTCTQFDISVDVVGGGLNDNLAGIYIRYCHDFRFHNSLIDGVTAKPASGYTNHANAFQIWDSYRFAITENEIRNNGMNGVYVALNCYDFRVDQNNIHNNAASGVQIAWTGTNSDDFPYRWSCSHNIISYNRADAIDANNTHPLGIKPAKCTIIGNLLSYNGWTSENPATNTPTSDGSGCTLVNLIDVVVSGNIITEPSRNGLYAVTCQDVVLLGNIINKTNTGTAGDGIYLESVQRGRIVNNKSYRVAGTGSAVKLYGVNYDLILENNDVNGAWTNPSISAGVCEYNRVLAAHNTIVTANTITAYYDFTENAVSSSVADNVFDCAANVNIIRNKISSTGASAKGVNCGGNANVNVDGNNIICTGASSLGIRLNSAAQPKATNNYIESVGRCLEVDTCTQPIITGNRAKNTGSANSYYVNACTNGVKFGNVVVAGPSSFGVAGQYDINF